MDCKKIWEKYLKIKRFTEGKSYSSSIDIRSLMLESNHEIKILHVDEIYLESKGGKKITSLPQLHMIKNTTSDSLTLMMSIKSLFYKKDSNGNLEIIRNIEKKKYDRLGKNKKLISEEVFRYLWEVTQEGIERMYLKLRLLTPIVINSYTPREWGYISEILIDSGFKTISLPKDLNTFGLNLFMVGDRFLKTKDSITFLESTKKVREKYGLDVTSIDRLLELCKQD